MVQQSQLYNLGHGMLVLDNIRSLLLCPNITALVSSASLGLKQNSFISSNYLILLVWYHTYHSLLVLSRASQVQVHILTFHSDTGHCHHTAYAQLCCLVLLLWPLWPTTANTAQPLGQHRSKSCFRHRWPHYLIMFYCHFINLWDLAHIANLEAGWCVCCEPASPELMVQQAAVLLKSQSLPPVMTTDLTGQSPLQPRMQLRVSKR